MNDGKLTLLGEILCRFVVVDVNADGSIVNLGMFYLVYMGLLGLPMLCDGLVAHGMSAETPAAVIQQGTTREQRVVTGTLGTLPQAVAAAMLTPPTLLIIGDVVRLRERLAWFRPARNRSERCAL